MTGQFDCARHDTGARRQGEASDKSDRSDVSDEEVRAECHKELTER